MNFDSLILVLVLSHILAIWCYIEYLSFNSIQFGSGSGNFYHILVVEFTIS